MMSDCDGFERQVIDVFHVANGPEAALREAHNRAGTWFDPALVTALDRVAMQPGFWAMIGAGQGDTQLQAPAGTSAPVDEDYLDDIAAAFAQVVDSKAPTRPATASG
jgi:hypothetical protein